MTTSSPTRTSRAASLPWELRFVRPPYADLQVNHGLPCPDSAGTLGILTLPEVDLTAPLHRVLRTERETGPCPIILEVMAMLGPAGDAENTSFLPSFLPSFLGIRRTGTPDGGDVR